MKIIYLVIYFHISTFQYIMVTMMKALTSLEMQEFEKYACDNFKITVEDMIQNAGKAVFDFVMEQIKPSCVLVVAGKGHNGGDALVAARLLYKAGAVVTIMMPYSDSELSEYTLAQLEKVRKIRIPIIFKTDEIDLRKRDMQSAASDGGFDLIIDGLFGFSLKGNPKSPADEIINWMNFSGIPILSVDVPSGLDSGTGQVMEPTIKAFYTVTLGMPKIGLDKHREFVGNLYLGNVGIPQRTYQKLDIHTPIFLGKSYVTLD
ncbi:NAD(P)H-hydrate epimerase [Candidatus Peregrinibacteria bacterium]|nr:NAD(P)H-hydrate epimerase [Candidatus Peregrinibacteria bacterium]